MKKPAIALFLVIVSIHSGFSQSSNTSTGPDGALAGSLSAHYKAIRSFHPRLEGSEGEDRTLDYLQTQLSELGYSLYRRGFTALADAHSFSQLARVDLPGDGDGRFYVLVPLNHGSHRNPTEDGSVSVAASLALAEAIAANRSRPTVSILYLGADVGDRRLGSRLFLSELEIGDRESAIYLDITGAGRPISARLAAGGISAPRWLSERVVRLLVDSDLPSRQYSSTLQASRSRLSRNGVIEPYLRHGLATVRIRSELPGPPEPRPTAGGAPTEAWAAQLEGFLYALITKGPPPALQSWDRHYVYATAAETVVFLGERSYLLLLLVVLISPIVYGLVFQRRLSRYTRIVGRNAWSLLVLLGLTFFFFFVSTALIRGIMDFRGFPTLWQYAPGSYFILKLVISIFLFAFVFQSLRQLPFPRSGSFYSGSAVFLLFLDVLILAIADVAFTFYFLWAFLFGFLFSIAKSPWLKGLFFLASPLWLIIGMVELFLAAELPAVESLLLSAVGGNLLFAFVLLPFLLMLIRLDMMLHSRLRLPHGGTLRLTVLGSAAAAVLFASGLVFLEPFSVERPQPVEVTEVIDAEAGVHRLELRSPAPMDGLTFYRGESSYEVEGETRAHSLDLGDQAPPQVLLVESTSREFLSRSRREVVVESRLAPASIDARLSSDAELLIYDADFPYGIVESPTAVEFRIGRYPPNPLSLRYTVPLRTRTRTEIEVRSEHTLEPIGTEDPLFRLEPNTRARHRIEQ